MDSSKYHHLLAPNNGSPISSNDSRRKSLVHMLSASAQSLDNLSHYSLLGDHLMRYLEQSKGVYTQGFQVILNKTNRNGAPLHSSLSQLPRASLLNLVKPLSCSGGVKCNKSENFSKEEFDELYEVLRNRKDPEVFECKVQSTQGKSFEFKTALDELKIQQIKKYGTSSLPQNGPAVGQKRKVGLSRRNINSKFVSPTMKSSEEVKSDEWPLGEVDERYKNIEPKMVEMIKSEIMDSGPTIEWNDIAGLTFAKTTIQEAVVWPMLRPDIFTGLRKPPKGILLFGPPGTGKTLIGKCVASQSKSTFFSISASSLTSKWVGDGEKMVRALFTVARVHQPSVIFIDEIDSLLSQRSDTEHESSRRIKTEFLVQLDGATTDSEERLLVIGATNRPQELDEAARRRFVKRLYIPLPENEARLQLLQNLIHNENHQLTHENFNEIAEMSQGYSGADIKNLCSEASLGPIRSIDKSLISHISASDVRPLLREDFMAAFSRVRASVAPKDLDQYLQWDNTYGSG